MTSAFSESELEYLRGERRLARIATVGSDGTPHIAPVGYSYDAAHDAIVVGGRSMEQTKKYRDVRRSGRAAIVIDDVLPPWQPRGVEVRGRAEARLAGGEEVGKRLGAPFDFDPAWILVRPTRIVSWGIDGPSYEVSARDAVKAG